MRRRRIYRECEKRLENVREWARREKWFGQRVRGTREWRKERRWNEGRGRD